MVKKLLAVIVGGTFIAGLVYLNEQFRGTPELHWGFVPEAPLEVEVGRPTRRKIIHSITAAGTIEPVVEVDVSSQVVGRIVRLPVRDGDKIRSGNLLAKLDDAEYAARVRSAEARVARLEAAIRRANADLEKSQRDMDRAQRLASQSAASSDEIADAATQLESMTATRQMAQQDLVEARASLEMANEDLSYTVIESPIDGIVSQVLVEEGEVVIPGTMNNAGTVMMVVSNTDQMQVRARIDEADVTRVRAGQRAWIYLTADAQGAIEGVVERVTPKAVQRMAAQGEAVTFETRILIQEATDAVRSGMTANVVIEVRQRDDALTLPIQAVRHRKRSELPDALKKQAASAPSDVEPSEGPERRGPVRSTGAEYLKVVFVLEDGVARMRLVETDISDEMHVEIRRGLDDDDNVIIGPYRVLDVLSDGRAVSTQSAAQKQGQS